MPLIEVNAELSEVVRELRRIADALDRLAPPIPEDLGPPSKVRVFEINDRDEWLRENSPGGTPGLRGQR